MSLPQSPIKLLILFVNVDKLNLCLYCIDRPKDPLSDKTICYFRFTNLTKQKRNIYVKYNSRAKTLSALYVNKTIKRQTSAHIVIQK